MGIAEFFARKHWGTRFGTHDAMHPLGHHGHDIVAAGRTRIPAIRSGVVVHRGTSSALGYVLVIQHSEHEFDGYAHTRWRARVGTKVHAGDNIARVASWFDFHGKSWTGPHLHLTRGASINAVYGIGSIDPYPVVVRALEDARP